LQDQPVNRFFLSLLLVLLAPANSGRPAAQPSSHLPIVLSHFGTKVKDMEASRRFWITTLGGKAGVAVRPDGPGRKPLHVAFPGIMVEMGPDKAEGGTNGSTIDHLGFEVKNLRKTVDSLKRAGFRIVTAAAMPPGRSVNDEIGILPDVRRSVAYVMSADDVEVELVENAAMTEPIAFSHVHFMAPPGQRPAMREWYKRALGATDGQSTSWYDALDMPEYQGLLLFSDAKGPVKGTTGRVLNHMGFEVKNLRRAYPDLKKRMPGLTEIGTYEPQPEVTFTFTKDPFGTDVQFGEHPAGLFFAEK
jgi:hypothetical protein